MSRIAHSMPRSEIWLVIWRNEMENHLKVENTSWTEWTEDGIYAEELLLTYLFKSNWIYSLRKQRNATKQQPHTLSLPSDFKLRRKRLKSSNTKHVHVIFPIAVHWHQSSVRLKGWHARVSSLHLPFRLFPQRRLSPPLSPATPAKAQLHLNTSRCAKTRERVLTELKKTHQGLKKERKLRGWKVRYIERKQEKVERCATRRKSYNNYLFHLFHDFSSILNGFSANYSHNGRC